MTSGITESLLPRLKGLRSAASAAHVRDVARYFADLADLVDNELFRHLRTFGLAISESSALARSSFDEKLNGRVKAQCKLLKKSESADLVAHYARRADALIRRLNARAKELRDKDDGGRIFIAEMRPEVQQFVEGLLEAAETVAAG